MRLLDVISRTQSLQTEIKVVDVTQAPPAMLRGVSAVPAIVFADGKVITGTQCFEYAKGHEKDMSLDCGGDFLSGGGMLYSSIDSGAGAAAQRVTSWADFE